MYGPRRNDATDEGEVDDSKVDRPIVTQEPIPVYDGDDEETLKERVLYQGEFKAYPRAVSGSRRTTPRSIRRERVHVEADTGERIPRPNASKRRPHRRASATGRTHTRTPRVYADATCEEASVVHAEQLNEGAKALSYNNYNDADGALNLIKEFDEPAAAVIKHTNPAGCAVADTLAEAYESALSTDPKSAFGGIVALNRECDAATAEQIVDSFKEVVVAPGYTDDALSTYSPRRKTCACSTSVRTRRDHGDAHREDQSSADDSCRNATCRRRPSTTSKSSPSANRPRSN